MNIVAKIEKEMGAEWIPNIYRGKIRSQRTRAITLEIPQKENQSVIEHTLLGIELRIGRTRFSCPDLSTARYMQVFSWLGSKEFASPYDITKISGLADELESSWHKMILLFNNQASKKSPQARGRQRAALFREIRKQLDEIGAGTKMPEFKKSTKQRRKR